MATRLTLFAIFLFVVISASGCSVFSPAAGSPASIMPADAAHTPADAQPAMVWTIDGDRVPARYGKYRLTPGVHTVSVVPRQESHRATVEYGETAAARGVRIATATIDMGAGTAIRLAAIVRRHRTYAGDGDTLEPLEEWQTTVLPYVIDDSQPEFVVRLSANSE